MNGEGLGARVSKGMKIADASANHLLNSSRIPQSTEMGDI
jgi:hypothetical protein